MIRPIILGAGILTLLGAAVGWRASHAAASDPPPFESVNRPPTAGPPCPWRDPEGDVERFFPGATGYALETRILSGARVELTRRLGRAPTGDENALRVYRVTRDDKPLGVVLTGRVKGAFGGIEMVLAVGADERVRGLRVQRHREPPSCKAALLDSDWLRAFEGKRADDSWKLGVDIPDVAAGARVSAQAMVAGTRDLLVFLATANPAHSHEALH